ncbi:MAG: MarR family winged helix-turn-helix transcriptional regulator [Phycisphaerae bacterium]
MSAESSQSVPRPCACTTVRTASRLLARVYEHALQDSTLNVTQLAVLRSIDRMPGEPMIRVAEALSMDRTSIYRAVATMERHGWVRIDGGKDARSSTVAITPLGRAMLDDAAPYWDNVQSDIVDRFGRRRWRSLVAELQALAETASKVENDQVARRARRGE